jgi:hypothetical protein
MCLLSLILLLMGHGGRRGNEDDNYLGRDMRGRIWVYICEDSLIHG